MNLEAGARRHEIAHQPAELLDLRWASGRRSPRRLDVAGADRDEVIVGHGADVGGPECDQLVIGRPMWIEALEVAFGTPAAAGRADTPVGGAVELAALTAEAAVVIEPRRSDAFHGVRCRERRTDGTRSRGRHQVTMTIAGADAHIAEADTLRTVQQVDCGGGRSALAAEGTQILFHVVPHRQRRPNARHNLRANI